MGETGSNSSLTQKLKKARQRAGSGVDGVVGETGLLRHEVAAHMERPDFTRLAHSLRLTPSQERANLVAVKSDGAVAEGA